MPAGSGWWPCERRGSPLRRLGGSLASPALGLGVCGKRQRRRVRLSEPHRTGLLPRPGASIRNLEELCESVA